MLERELAIVLRARLTWLQAALSALLVGHGFVLAVDLYSAGSRSVAGARLMAREFDPLLGVVRPTLGGLYLAVSLLGPLVAARALAVEKERRTFRALLLQTGRPLGLVAAKSLAALAGVALQLVAPLVLLAVWRLAGGHLAAAETATALLGYALYVAMVAAIAVAAAAWTETLAQAATLAVLVVAASWAIDASEGFAALAWLGRALDWSVTTHLYPMERGTLAVGACLWMTAVVGGAPAAARQLAALPGSITLDVYLDRDDARRRQLESDVLAKLRLARPDLEVRMPTDEQADATEAGRDEGYGRVVVHAGGGTRETRSTSRREIVSLIFEAAGYQLPDWSQPEYPGYPLVIAGGRRRALVVSAYLGIPLAPLVVGWILTRSKGRS